MVTSESRIINELLYLRDKAFNQFKEYLIPAIEEILNNIKIKLPEEDDLQFLREQLDERTTT